MTVTVRDEGITVVSENSTGDAPVADLVFIHGLQGHSRRTWTHPKTITKTNKEGVFWPRDLLCEDFLNIRVLTYGYDSQVSRFFSATNQSSIFAHGQKFLRALKRERLEAPKRPLIFLAHSLGGIITKEALHQALESKDETENDILSSTHTVVFFGTPHRGSPYASMGQVVERAARVLFSTNPKILRNLNADGEMLDRIRMEFARLLDEHEIQAYSFQEGKGLSGIKFFSKKVVENTSSKLDHRKEKSEEINANHTMMCRYLGRKDEGYVQVKGVIADYLKEITRKISLDDAKLLDECLKSLYSPTMNQRRLNIEPAEPHTFEWIFTANATGFPEWLLDDGCFLWIKGKPAAGKSTLLKYVYEDDNTSEILKSRWNANAAIASFFFYDQTNTPQWRSFDGLLHSLLYELLYSIPELFRFMVGAFRALRRNPEPIWERLDLEKAISIIGKQQDVTGCICLFMDALDEYPGDCKEIVRNIKRLMESFAHGTLKLKICASSRPLNEFEAMLPQFPGFAQIAVHDWTLDDITTIVSRRLQEADRGDMPRLRKEIISKAKGSFIWVNLVLKTLSVPLFHFESEEELLDRLSLLANDLEPFYKQALEKIPRVIRSKMWMVLQLMFCNANRDTTLTLAEISLAVKLPEGSEIWQPQPGLSPADDLTRCQQLMTSIQAYLGAFIELWKRSLPYSFEPTPSSIFKPLTKTEYDFTRSSLRFSHKTARDFILSSTSAEIFESDVSVDFGLAGHARLCKLYTLIAGAPHAMYHLLNPVHLEFGETSINHFDTDLMVLWGIHARELEYFEYVSLLGQDPDCHNIYDSSLLTEKNKYTTWPHPPYHQTVKDSSSLHVSESARIIRSNTFNETITATMGTSWPQKWAEKYGFALVAENWASPPSFLAFALLNGLFLYARDVLTFDTSYPLNHSSPPLLFWAVASCDYIEETTVLEIWRDEAERCHKFAHYLLQRGADPNANFRKSFQQTFSDFTLGEARDLKRPLDSGHADITLLHFALGVYLKSCVDETTEQKRMAMLEMICILVRYGAKVGKTLYKNYWEQRLEATERTLLHYICFSRDYKYTYSNGYVQEFQPFLLFDEGPVLCRTVKTLLDHDADPNALDSDGRDVLSCMMEACPYELIEYALEKGALISTSLLRDEDGSPVQKHGILLEERWKRPECYTPEAREIVRKHMPHWKEIVEEAPPVPTVDNSAMDITSG